MTTKGALAGFRKAGFVLSQAHPNGSPAYLKITGHNGWETTISTDNPTVGGFIVTNLAWEVSVNDDFVGHHTKTLKATIDLMVTPASGKVTHWG